jgi:hypothetical protein
LQTVIYIEGKPVAVSLSEAAQHAVQRRDTPLLVEMELYFSCLIRTRVRFYDNNTAGDAVAVNEHLKVRFRPVMTKQCGRDYEGDEPPLTDFPISNSQAFIPKWLEIDCKHNQWTGEFGFADR